MTLDRAPPARQNHHGGAYRMKIAPRAGRLSVVFNDVVIADSRESLVMHETAHAPVGYFPRKDVRMELLHSSSLRTHCPFKGDATYWSVQVGDRRAENAAWSYEAPLPESAAIASYIAFDLRSMDGCYEEGRPAQIGGDAPVAAPGNPLLRWLLQDAPSAEDARALIQSLIRELVAAGVPLWRAFVLLRTLHPQLVWYTYHWCRHEDGLEEKQLPYSLLETREYLESPLVPIFNGAGGIRRRLDVPEPVLDFPILRDLHDEGATDYVAMPIRFTDGRVSVITLSSDRHGGFNTADLGAVYEILPVLGRLLEMHAVRRNSVTLLDTYLGRRSGERVLKGQIRRGDGEHIHAVIWFCDLRESTRYASSMSREQFLKLLNKFFDCMGGPVLAHGGEILRFIGDAALAIFPIHSVEGASRTLLADPSGCPVHREACARALAAAREARVRLEAANLRRLERGRIPFRYGIALHVGDVTWGNIGTGERLEFTVVGAAANNAARIEALCRELDRWLLLSSDFVRCLPGDYASLGSHVLRGVAEPQQVWTLPEPTA
jgi:adenylate cyclase